jgi:hypothetical protein
MKRRKRIVSHGKNRQRESEEIGSEAPTEFHFSLFCTGPPSLNQPIPSKPLAHASRHFAAGRCCNVPNQ